MSQVILPIEVGADVASDGYGILGGEYMTFNLSGNVSTGSLEIQHSWDKTDPAAWRQLIEDSVPKQCDVNNSAVRVRGPLWVRVVRRGGDAIGCTVSNLSGNRDL